MAASDDPLFEKRVGTVLKGKWTLEKLLGVGGMAAVYAARHRIGNEVAIKILHPEVAISKELCLRFEREAKVANRLRHPGAVAVTDVDTTADGVPFMVMELLHGEPLSALLRRPDGVPQEEGLRFVDELLDVLAAAHGQGIVHRDIKLDNLFVTEDGSLKVLDFGIARLRDGMAMTVHGAMLGTLPYMPPEQAKGLSIDGRADLFAVGAVMFRLVSKRRIHQAKSEPELLAKMTTEPAPPLSSVAPEAPEGLCLVTDRALAFDRNDRYPDAATMREDVQALRRGEPPPYATRKLGEVGPPNPAVAPGAAGEGAPKAQTVATRAASPAAVRGDADPAGLGTEPTAAASPFATAPSDAAQPGPPPASGSAARRPPGKTEILPSTEAAAAPHTLPSAAAATPAIGLEPTAAGPPQEDALALEPTAAATPHGGALAVAGVTGSPGPTEVMEPDAEPASSEAPPTSGPIATSPTLVAGTAPALSAAPAVSTVPSTSGPAPSQDQSRSKRLGGAIAAILAAVVAIVLVIVLWPSGTTDTETDDETDEETAASDEDDDDDDETSSDAPPTTASGSATTAGTAMPSAKPATTTSASASASAEPPSFVPPLFKFDDDDKKDKDDDDKKDKDDDDKKKKGKGKDKKKGKGKTKGKDDDDD